MVKMINLINTSTAFPVRDEERELFYQIFDNQSFFQGVQKQRDVNIFFVCEEEIDHELINNEIPKDEVSFDTLGIYIYHDAGSLSSTIKVCPEKIIKTVMNICELAPFDKYDTDLLYNTLLIGVIIHELGHCFMDPTKEIRQGAIPRSIPGHPQSAQRQIKRLLENRAFKLRLGEINSIQKHTRNRIERFFWSKKFSWYKIFEESLAERYIIKHRFKPNELEILWAFIDLSPYPYWCGCSWKNNTHIIEIIVAWRTFKQKTLNRKVDIADILNQYDPNQQLFNEIINKMDAKSAIDEKINFEHILVDYLKLKYDELLNKGSNAEIQHLREILECTNEN